MKFDIDRLGRVPCDKFIRSCKGDRARFSILTESVNGNYCSHCAESLANRELERARSLLIAAQTER